MEEVGFSDPVKKKKVLKAERIKYWISVGAQPSDSIHNLLISEKIIEGKKIPVHKKKKVKEGTGGAAAPTAPAALPKPAAEQKPVVQEKPADLSAEAQGAEEEAEAAVEAVAGEVKKEEAKTEETPIAEEKKIEAPAEETENRSSERLVRRS